MVDNVRTEASYGPAVGSLLWSEKECEEKFDSLNIVDQQHMEPYDSDLIEEQNKPLAYENQSRIEKNIPSLVRYFRKDELRARIMKEYKDIIKGDGQNFIVTFTRMKDLWYQKLCTSLEEYNRNMEQLQVSKKRVTELEEQLKKKSEDLETFKTQTKEAREQRNKEIDDLKHTQTKLKQDKLTAEDKLNESGLNRQKRLIEEHEKRKKNLNEEITSLKQELTALVHQNREVEK